MAEAGFRKPNNGVLLDPKNNAIISFFNVETATNVKPGRRVKRGTTDDDIVVSTASASGTGWAGYEHTPAAFKPADRDTTYAASDRLAVISGTGFNVRAILGTSETVVKGDKLGAADSSGCLHKMVGSADPSGCVAVAAESVTTTTQVAAIWVEAI